MRLDVTLAQLTDRNVMLSQSFIPSLLLIAAFTGAALASAGENLPAPQSVVVVKPHELAKRMSLRTIERPMKG